MPLFGENPLILHRQTMETVSPPSLCMNIPRVENCAVGPPRQTTATSASPQPSRSQPPDQDEHPVRRQGRDDVALETPADQDELDTQFPGGWPEQVTDGRGVAPVASSAGSAGNKLHPMREVERGHVDEEDTRAERQEGAQEDAGMASQTKSYGGEERVVPAEDNAQPRGAAGSVTDPPEASSSSGPDIASALKNENPPLSASQEGNGARDDSGKHESDLDVGPAISAAISTTGEVTGPVAPAKDQKPDDRVNTTFLQTFKTFRTKEEKKEAKKARMQARGRTGRATDS